MPMFMVNLRMRRVELIVQGDRYNPKAKYKHYKAKYKHYKGSRDWMLADTQVFPTQREALEKLITALKARRADEQRKVDRLSDDIAMVNSTIRQLEDGL